MASLPVVSGPEAIRAFERIDFVVVRIKGSHHVMKKNGHPTNVVVPCHGNKPIRRGTLRSIIDDAGLTVDEFIDLL